MLAAIRFGSLRHFVEIGDLRLSPAVRVAAWDESGEALVADGAEEVLVGVIVECLPALVPRTSTSLNHCQQFLGVRRPVRQATCQLFEVLRVGLILVDKPLSCLLRGHVFGHHCYGLRRYLLEESVYIEGMLMSVHLVELPRFGPLGVWHLVSLLLLVGTNPDGLLLLLH